MLGKRIRVFILSHLLTWKGGAISQPASRGDLDVLASVVMSSPVSHLYINSIRERPRTRVSFRLSKKKSR